MDDQPTEIIVEIMARSGWPLRLRKVSRRWKAIYDEFAPRGHVVIEAEVVNATTTEAGGVFCKKLCLPKWLKITRKLPKPQYLLPGECPTFRGIFEPSIWCDPCMPIDP